MWIKIDIVIQAIGKRYPGAKIKGTVERRGPGIRVQHFEIDIPGRPYVERIDVYLPERLVHRLWAQMLLRRIGIDAAALGLTE